MRQPCAVSAPSMVNLRSPSPKISLDNSITIVVSSSHGIVHLASCEGLPSHQNPFFLETSMSTLSSKDRLTLCTFTFADGRRCRTPRQPAVAGQPGHPHLCFFHARKEAQARAADQVGRDVSGFLSGSYLSACDLNSALARLFAAVAQGNIKPRTAATLAYLGQT